MTCECQQLFIRSQSGLLQGYLLPFPSTKTSCPYHSDGCQGPRSGSRIANGEPEDDL